MDVHKGSLLLLTLLESEDEVKRGKGGSEVNLVAVIESREESKGL